MASLTNGRSELISVILATGNPGKLQEFQSLLGDCVRLKSQSDFGISSVAETGSTFIENALIKARHAAKLTNMPAIADDSGLEVDVLDGAPGVRSARYAGEGAGDLENLTKLLNQLEGIGPEERTARFRCVLVLVRDADDSNPMIAEGVWEGRIATEPKGDNGFGYDPVFVDGQSGITAAQLDGAEKNLCSHRGAAARQLRKKINMRIRADEER